MIPMTTIKSDTVGMLPCGFVKASVGDTSFETCNTACVAAAKAIAAAYAGDLSLVPCGVVFLYGNEGEEAGITADSALTWQDVKNSGVEMTDVLPFSYRASVDGNKVTFHARTKNIASGKVVNFACLVGRSQSGDGYEVLAIVDLGGKKKPEDFEMSIDWTVKFKDTPDAGGDSEEYVS